MIDLTMKYISGISANVEPYRICKESIVIMQLSVENKGGPPWGGG
jgi:hypothetical protein